MKNIFLPIALLAAGMIFAGACKEAGVTASGVTNDASNNIAALKTGPEPAPAKKGKTRKEIDIENGSVKADDYEEHSGFNKNPDSACDIYAYIVDKDPAGLNVRDSDENGQAIGKIPFDTDGTIVHLISTNFTGWVRIDHAETVEGKVVFDKKGWVSANLLATSAAGYGTQEVELTESASGSKVLTFIPPETEVRMFSCDGKRARVKYKKFTGWLGEDAACPNPVTNCS
jgi:SH3-like domain-containing protein